MRVAVATMIVIALALRGALGCLGGSCPSAQASMACCGAQCPSHASANHQCCKVAPGADRAQAVAPTYRRPAPPAAATIAIAPDSPLLGGAISRPLFILSLARAAPPGATLARLCSRQI